MKINFHLAGDHTWDDSSPLQVVSVQPGADIGELDVLLRPEPDWIPGTIKEGMPRKER